MPHEIEHKFLVNGNSYQKLAQPVFLSQGYLAILPDKEIRVRLTETKSYLTLKNKISDTVRNEFEYEIPLQDAEFLIKELCPAGIIQKYRYRIPFEGLIWEVDEFCGENEGLVLAEVELSNENQHFEKPDFIGREVSGDNRYLNAHLALHPFKTWPDEK